MKSFLLILRMFAFAAASSAAVPPGILNHQGVISVDGIPFNGAGSFKFALVDAAGTTTFWSNDGTSTTGDEPTSAVSLTVSSGLFSVTLGDTGIANMTAEIPASVFADNAEVYLRVWFDDGVNGSQLLSPDQRLGAVGYALSAAQAQSVPDGAITSSMLAAGSVGTDQLAPGAEYNGTFSGDGSGLTSLDSASLTGILTVDDTPLPRNIAHIDDGGAAVGVTVAGNYAYLANVDDGLRIYDISTPDSPVNVGHIDDNASGYARSVAVSGSHAHVANGVDGLRIYDITDPSNPVEVGHIMDGNNAQSVAVSGSIVYLANATAGLWIYDITDPANPVSLGLIDNGGWAHDVTVSGNYAYLANSEDGLRIYDISTPGNPVNVGHINNGGSARGVAVLGHLAYVANSTDGLRIYDITDPFNPLNVGHIDDGDNAQNVSVSGGYAYLANYSDGLRIYEISDPANPVSVGHIDNGEFAYDVAVSGHYAYLANSADGLRVYNVSGSVSAPRFQGSFVGDGSELMGIDLGAHTATQALNLSGNDITSAGTVTATAFLGDGSGLTGISVDDADADPTNELQNLASVLGLGSDGGGSNLSNLAIVTATAFVGDGSGLTDLPGDGLGNHTANQALNLNGNYLSGDGDSEGVYVDAAGKVGVGLNSPSQALEVAGNIKLNAPDPGITFYDGTGGLGARQSSINTVFRANFQAPPYTAADQEMQFNVSNNSGTGTRRVMTLLGDGSVGIGNVDPQSELEVEATVPEIRLTDNRADSGGLGGEELGKISWYSRDTSNANDYDPVAAIEIVTDNGTVAPDGRFQFRTGTNGILSTRMVISSDGSVGIGTTNPSAKLHVVGNILASGTINGASDRNVKENFAEVDPLEMLERVSSMPIQRWNYIGENVPHIGPVAQDFYGAFQVGMDDKHISMVDADGVALAAIQGLNQKLNERDAEINELKATVAQLRQLVESIARDGGR